MQRDDTVGRVMFGEEEVVMSEDQRQKFMRMIQERTEVNIERALVRKEDDAAEAERTDRAARRRRMRG